MKFFNKISLNVRGLNNWGQLFKFKNMMYLVPVILALIPTISFAADIFEIPKSDISLKILGALFGGLMSTGGNDPLLGAIKIFNGGVLMIGGVLAGYTILAGTIGTAHDGEMLGKKFSSAWIPIRYSLGTALVLPVVGGGYCVMQVLVMWLIMQGIGLADQVWISFMANAGSTANFTFSGGARTAIVDVAQNAFKSSVCYQSYQRVIDTESKSGSFLNWKGSYKYTKQELTSGFVYGDEKSRLFKNGCGVVNFPQDKIIDVTVTNKQPSTNPGYLGDFSTIFKPMDVSVINKLHNVQTSLLVDKMDLLATEAINKSENMSAADSAIIYKKIQDSADVYMLALNDSVKNMSGADAYADIKKAAGEQGWILAGAWFTRIIQMNQAIYSAVNSTPTSRFSSPVMDATIFSDAAKYLRSIDMVMQSEKDAGTTDTFNLNEDGTSNKSSGKVTDSGGVIKRIESKVTSALTGVNLYELKNDARHPIIIANALGERLTAICLTIMILLAGLGALVAALPGAGDSVKVVLDILGWFIDVPVKILMGTAMGTQYILPNMPFIIWIGCIIGWVLLVIEAVIAAPLWAVMHLHPNGDDLTGKGGNGYTLTLSLLLRPVLMVFGMITALIISSVIGEFINKTFFEVFAQSSGAFTGFTALMGLAMGTLLYFIILFIFLQKVFGIIHQLPDQMLRWVGGSDNTLGQFAGGFAEAGAKGGAAGAALGGAMASSAGKLGGKGAAKIAELQQKAGKADGAPSGEDGGFDGKVNSAFAALIPGMSKGPDGKLRNASGRAALAKEQGEKSEQENKSLSSAKSQQAEKSFDGKVGAGATATRDGFSSLKDNPEGVESYNQGIGQAVSQDKDNGKDNFEQAFAQSEASGHASHGGSAANAAQAIGKSVAMSGLESKAQNIPLSDSFIAKTSSLNVGDVSKAVSAMNKWSKESGPAAVGQAISNALGEPTPEAAFKSFQDAYQGRGVDSGEATKPANSGSDSESQL